MPNPTFTPQLDLEQYRFVEDETQAESTIVSYGEVSALAIGPAIYYCQITDPDAESAEVFRVGQAVAMETNEPEDVDFEEPDEEEDEDEVEEVTVPDEGEDEEEIEEI